MTDNAKIGGVTTQLSELDSQLERMSKILADCEVRLEPVLRTTSPQCTAKDSCEGDGDDQQCEIASALSRMIGRANKLTDELSWLLDRCDV